MEETLSSLTYHSLAEECLSSVQVWAIMNAAAGNLHVEVLHGHYIFGAVG